MKYLFICYPQCTTCRRAKKWLDENQIQYEERHIKKDNPNLEELEKWTGGLSLKKFFNTSGTLYKEMNLKEKLPQMTEQEQLELLATDGMLVKRPLLVSETTTLVGFTTQEWEKIIKD